MRVGRRNGCALRLGKEKSAINRVALWSGPSRASGPVFCLLRPAWLYPWVGFAKLSLCKSSAPNAFLRCFRWPDELLLRIRRCPRLIRDSSPVRKTCGTSSGNFPGILPRSLAKHLSSGGICSFSGTTALDFMVISVSLGSLFCICRLRNHLGMRFRGRQTVQ